MYIKESKSSADEGVKRLPRTLKLQRRLGDDDMGITVGTEIISTRSISQSMVRLLKLRCDNKTQKDTAYNARVQNGRTLCDDG
jgi:hypothetical protein